MTQEEIELLFQDLCARLPYGVKVTFAGYSGRDDCILNSQHLNSTYAIEYLKLKPYLRPLSSMTEEERKEVGEAAEDDYIEPYGEIKSSGEDNLLLSVVKSTTNIQDYLYRKGFDIRGLIPKGLALEAPEGMYNK